MTTHATPKPAGFINASPGINDTPSAAQDTRHEVILQALERYLTYGDDANPTRIYYGVDNYEGTEPEWDRTPAVFVDDGTHPDLTLFSTNPDRALAKVKGRYAGTLAGTEVIPAPGQPRARSWLTITDPEAAALYAAGQLGISTALTCRHEDGRLQGKVQPNHVLLFRQSPRAQPRDAGAMFLNTILDDTNDSGGPLVDKIDEILANFSNSLKNLLGPGQGGNDPAGGGEGGNDPNMTPDDEKLKLANSTIEQRDQEIKTLKEQATAKDNELANAQKELEKYRTEEANKTWTGLKNTTIPPGMVKTPEDEKALRELYNTDRDGFWQKILSVRKAGPGGKEGSAWVNSEKFRQVQEANSAWDQATGASIKL